MNREEAEIDLSTRSETATLRTALARAGLTLAEGPTLGGSRPAPPTRPRNEPPRTFPGLAVSAGRHAVFAGGPPGRDVAFVAGMAIAYFLDPVVDRFETWRFGRLGHFVVLLLFFLLAVGVILLIVPVLEAQVAPWSPPRRSMSTSCGS